jgi:hypothetical protein
MAAKGGCTALLLLAGSFTHGAVARDCRAAASHLGAPWWQSCLAVSTPLVVGRAGFALVRWLQLYKLLTVPLAWLAGVLRLPGAAAAVGSGAGWLCWAARASSSKALGDCLLGPAPLRWLGARAAAWLGRQLAQPWWADPLLAACGALAALGCIEWEKAHPGDDTKWWSRDNNASSSSSARPPPGWSQSRARSAADPGGAALPEKKSLDDFPLGYGPVAVPPGCDVSEVARVLSAHDYYQASGI